MEKNDPELRVLTDEKKTVDLCDSQHPQRARCVRVRGHEGPHEAVVWNQEQPLRWE